MTGISHDSVVEESTSFKRCNELRAELMIISLMMISKTMMMLLLMIMLTIIPPWSNF